MVDQKTSKEIIQKLFSLLNIRKVVFVDDSHAELSDDILQVENIIAFCKANEDIRSQIIEFQDVPFSSPDRVWENQIKKLWESYNYDIKKTIYSRLNSSQYDSDKKTSYTLQDLLGCVEVACFSLDKWRKEGKDLLDSDSANTLFLFDKDFSKEGGSETEGISIIGRIQDEYKDKKILCGILSHTFEATDEYSQWLQTAEEYQIDKNKFVLIAKKRLTDGDHFGFARMLKLTILNSHCSELKQEALTVVREALAKAKDDMDAINIYDFDHIVFQSSEKEGIWAPDTLFRIFTLFQKKSARKLAKSNRNLHDLADKVRTLNAISISSSKFSNGESWKIQRLEMYEDSEQINYHHLPIELGDIFQKGNKNYILLAQPCDLMVRSDGRRHHAITDALLAEITPKEPKETAMSSHFKLRYFDQSSGKDYYVSFRTRYTVKLSMLDTCVYQQDGTAKFFTNTQCPEIVIPTWKLHHDKIRNEIEQNLQIYNILNSCDLKEKDKNKILRDFTSYPSSGLFKAVVTNNSIDYGFKRVSRLCQPYSGELFKFFTNYLARTAFEHEFGESNMTEESLIQVEPCQALESSPNTN